MTGKILVLDSVATNRIVMKVKLVSARYETLTAATCKDALQLMEREKPDLLLINLSDPVEDSHQFCKRLKANPKFRDTAIVAIGIADTSRARFAALDAGADEVLPHPISDAFMLARIRGLLRRRIANLEWDIRNETSQALGFEEEVVPILAPAHLCLAPANANRASVLKNLFANLTQFSVSFRIGAEALSTSADNVSSEVFVIDAWNIDACALVSDIYSRPNLRNSQIMVVAPKGRSDIAVQALDFGAGEVVYDDISSNELAIRIDGLIQHKRRQDKQRKCVLSGLEAATLDPLTGLYNRRYAKTYLKGVAEQAFEKRESYALLIFDIDHFKQINDRFGHAHGDLVLKKVANCLEQIFRSLDLVARIGGEEFLVAMPETSLCQAELAAERVRETISRESFDFDRAESTINITVSAGVAVNDVLGKCLTPPEVLFSKADAALYEAKSSGRDKVALSAHAA